MEKLNIHWIHTLYAAILLGVLMTAFVYALKVLAVGILIGGGLMFFSGSRSQVSPSGKPHLLDKLKMIFKFIGKSVIFIAMLLLPFALLKIVGLI